MLPSAQAKNYCTEKCQSIQLLNFPCITTTRYRQDSHAWTLNIIDMTSIRGLPRRDSQDREATVIWETGKEYMYSRTYILLETECKDRRDIAVPWVQPRPEAKQSLRTKQLRHDNDKLYDWKSGHEKANFIIFFLTLKMLQAGCSRFGLLSWPSQPGVGSNQRVL